MLKKVLIFLVFAAIAYTFNVNLKFPWLTGVIFGCALTIAMQKQSQVSLLKLFMVTVIWSSVLFYLSGIGVLAAVKDALNGIALGADEAVMVGFIISIVNGLGFGMMRNFLLSNLKWSRYHWQCLIMSFVTGMVLGSILILKSDYNSFLMAHLIWFVGMGWVMTRNVNGLPNILTVPNSN